MGTRSIEAVTQGRSWDKVAMAFGGTHYPAKFNKLLLDTDIALTSIVPKHSLEGVDSQMFGQIIQKTSKFPRFVAVEWKGMGKHKERILGFASQFALEVIKL